MSKKHPVKNTRISRQQSQRSFWDMILYDGEKKPWKEVFADPMLRVVLGLLIFIVALEGLAFIWSSHRYMYYQPYVFKIGKMEQRGDKILISDERIPLVYVPIDMAENLTVGDSVTIIEKISGTGHRIIEKVEVRIHA